jgi:tetratricopeptide (TPR) repeat protein/tRNA A-37 threonylcarbamoyl transferase component Bud32
VSHPSDDQLLAYVQGFLPEAQARVIEEHSSNCERCRTVLADVARDLFGSTLGAAKPKDVTTAPWAEASQAALEPGAHLGRYVILEVVGRGAMGVVYAAYDPHLDRRVALKILRPDRRWMTGAEMRERLLREGQTMARLSHPNLVAVHDVGAVGDGVFLALEFVEGQTLRGWLAAEKRPWPAVLAAFLEAGRGLHAAHQSGIVHRDFKPDNVLVGKDGRLRVTDFGLALRSGEPAEPHSPSPAVSSSLSSPGVSPSLTSTGALVGTPAYMSPEQLSHRALDARSDQFSFCVALYEALYGERPFAAETFADLRAAFAAGAVRPPNDAGVPARLRRVLLRGLSHEPDRRYPDMKALLDALAPRPPPIRGLTVGALLTVAVLGAAMVWRWEAANAPLCHDGSERAVTAWSAADRARLRDAFAKTGLDYAPAVTATIERQLDAWSGRWAAARDEACSATRMRKVQPESLMQLKLQCLDERQREVRAVVDLWAAADAETVRVAAEGASQLPELARCADERALRERQPLPRDPEKAAKAEAAKRKLEQAHAHDVTGQLAPALIAAEEAMGLARQAEYLPLQAEAGSLAGGLKLKRGDMEGTLELLETAVNTSLRAGEDGWAVLSLSLQVFALVNLESRLDEALRRMRLADALSERLSADAESRIQILDYGALVLARRDQLEEAEKRGRQAVAISERLKGPKDLFTVKTRSDLGITLAAENRLEEALAIFRDTLAAHEEAVGPEHPDTVLVRNNVGSLLVLLRRPAEALPVLERTLRAWQRIHGEKHPLTANALINLAEADAGLGRWDEAVKLNERALAVLVPMVGADGQSLWEPLTNLGVDALGRNRPQEALAPLERALKVLAHSSPLENAPTRFTLAQALWAAGGDRARARRLAGEARDAYREAAKRFEGVNGERAAEIDAWLAGH